MKTKNKKSVLWSLAIKVIVFVLLVFALYKQLYQNEDVLRIPSLLIERPEKGTFFILFSLVLLMILNWSIEAGKWKLLIEKLTPIRFIRTLKAVLTGVTLGLFTPNRVGEFGGRILYVPRKFRIRAVVVSLIGSFSQNLATIIAGIVSTIVYLYTVENITSNVLFSLILVSSITVILLFLAYYNLDVVIQVFKRNKFLQRIYHYTEVLKFYHSKDLTLLLFLSLFRYSVYTAQYLIFLLLFGAEISVIDGVVAIGVIYLAQTVVPSFAIVELLTRLPIATLIFSKYGINVGITLAATSSIWVLNLIIPATFGYIFIFKYNFFKNKQS